VVPPGRSTLVSLIVVCLTVLGIVAIVTGWGSAFAYKRLAEDALRVAKKAVDALEEWKREVTR
jgi:hypothetical protein